ncbi:MAG: hypothetical protein JWQ48_2206 [Conexibacter sp.]|nr:hypothetical protein [Conexibacter sp.]
MLAPPFAGLDVRRAATARARLLGLAGLRALPASAGLLLPRTRSVHTFGMRFALDLVWLDDDGGVVRVDRGVPARRLRACRAARAVLELPAGTAPPAHPPQRKPVADGLGGSGLAGRPAPRARSL